MTMCRVFAANIDTASSNFVAFVAIVTTKIILHFLPPQTTAIKKEDTSRKDYLPCMTNSKGSQRWSYTLIAMPTIFIKL